VTTEFEHILFWQATLALMLVSNSDEVDSIVEALASRQLLAPNKMSIFENRIDDVFDLLLGEFDVVCWMMGRSLCIV
jgi:hypothetical protein